MVHVEDDSDIQMLIEFAVTNPCHIQQLFVDDVRSECDRSVERPMTITDLVISCNQTEVQCHMKLVNIEMTRCNDENNSGDF